MKKIFSTVAMVMVAFTAVVTMSSCQNDSPSAFNAAPQMPAAPTTTQQTTTQSTSSTTNQTKEYKYNVALTDDFVALFDFQITVSTSTEAKVYTQADFTQATKIVYNYVLGEDVYAAKTVDPFTVKADQVSSVKVKTIVTLKPNWKEILDGMNKKELDFYYKAGVSHSTTLGFTQDDYKCTEEYLNHVASVFADRLSK